MNMAAPISPPEPITNLETEAALICALLLDNQQIDRVADIVRPDDFSDPFFRQVFELALHERSLGKAVHAGSLRRAIGDDKARLLSQMSMGSGAVLIGAADFARELREVGRKRKVVDGIESLIAEARTVGLGRETSADELVSEIETVLAEANDEQQSRESTASEAIGRMVDNLRNTDNGVFSGIGSLDATLGPLRSGNLCIVGGRPGMGKSAVASSYALGAASRGHGTLFVSREMSEEELAERMACDLCFDAEVQVPYSAVTDRRVTVEQGRQIARAADHIRDMPLVIVDKGGDTLAKLNALVRRHKRRFTARNQRLELIVVDYLQLISPDAREKDLYTRVSEVSKGLKQLAKSHDVAVMALCQLSRRVEQREDKRPHMADLRDSGQIEQDADAICFLYAPEYYLLQEEESPEREAALQQEAGKIEFIVAKRRRGPGGVGYGRFYRSFQAVRG
jgi:replicative DNA helicase